MKKPWHSRLGALPHAVAPAAACFVAYAHASAQSSTSTVPQDAASDPKALPPLVVTSTRSPLEADRAPSAVTLITAEEMQQRQFRQVSDALRNVPGLNLVQTGSQGQLTTAFLRGLSGDAAQVLLDGVPINQGLSGAFNFADMTTENLERIEVVRGPQSAIYGPRAGGGVIHLVSRRGTGVPEATTFFEAGTFGTFRERATASGQAGPLDYSIGTNRLDSSGDRPNSEYRQTSGLMNVGVTPLEGLRIFTVAGYSLSDTGSPGSVTSPRPLDNLLTERWLLAPGLELKAAEGWTHRLVTNYDEERQVAAPLMDGFTGNTRAAFKRYQVDYQNEWAPAEWVKLTTGGFYSRVEADQQQPFILSGPNRIGDRTENRAVFAQLQVEPWKDLLLVVGGRHDHFSQFGDINTYRAAASYRLPVSGTVLRTSAANGFIPPSSQDKIFGDNFLLEPNKTRGFDAGFEQPLWSGKVRLGANYFRNLMSNLVGFDDVVYRAFNVGSAEARGAEVFFSANPIPSLTLTGGYTYLETEKTSSKDTQQPLGARLARRPRNELQLSADYLWHGKLRTGLGLRHSNGREELQYGDVNFDIEDYTVLRFWAEYPVTDRCKVFGRIENLTDEQYAEVVHFPNPGRAFYAGVSVRF
jgi:vitamin B12 transporter